MTDRILYPSHVEPVPESAERNVAKWYQPPSEPVRRKNYATALIASGFLLWPYPIPVPEAPSVAGWAQPPSQPIFKVSPHAALASSGLTKNVIPFISDVPEWAQPASQPIFLRSPHAALAASGQRFDPLPILPVPVVSSWVQPASIPVWHLKGLDAPWQLATVFVDWQPFIRTSDGDVYVKKIQDNQWLDERLLDEQRRREWERFREEMRFNKERRKDIEDAVYGPPIEYKYPGMPPLYKAPNTMPLAADVVKAQQIMQQVLAVKQAEEDERQLEKLLLDL